MRKQFEEKANLIEGLQEAYTTLLLIGGFGHWCKDASEEEVEK